MVLGLDAEAKELFDSFGLAARYDLVKGFAVGRTFQCAVARGRLAGEIADLRAVSETTDRYSARCQARNRARADAG